MLPSQAVFQFRDVVPTRGTAPRAISDLMYVKAVSSGRAAIAQALDIYGIGRGDEVLLPAYHCIAMVEPIIARQATPIFFPLNRNLSPDIYSIQTLLSPRTRALIAVHYFGFINDFQGCVALCRSSGAVFIEDCAHAYFGQTGLTGVGMLGDVTIGSTRKFFGVFDGGVIASQTNEAVGSLRLKGAGVGFEIKAAVNILDRAMAAGKLGLARPMVAVALRCKDWLWRPFKRRVAKAGVATLGAAEGAYSFESDWVYARPSLASRVVCALSAPTRIVAPRIRNYLSYMELFSGVEQVYPLFPDLAENVVPYLFPLYIRGLYRLMPAIRERRIPFQRFGDELWTEMDPTTCTVTQDYSRNVIQLPVHQGLSTKQINWIANELLAIIRGSP